MHKFISLLAVLLMISCGVSGLRQTIKEIREDGRISQHEAADLIDAAAPVYRNALNFYVIYEASSGDVAKAEKMASAGIGLARVFQTSKHQLRKALTVESMELIIQSLLEELGKVDSRLLNDDECKELIEKLRQYQFAVSAPTGDREWPEDFDYEAMHLDLLKRIRIIAGKEPITDEVTQ